MPYTPPPADAGPKSAVEMVRRRREHELVAIDGVLGLGIGRTEDGRDAIVVYLRDDSVRALVPTEIEGHPVETVVTGVIEAHSDPTS